MPEESTASPDDPQEALSASLDEACNAISLHRNRGLLVLYYPPPAPMTEQDLDDVYSAFRSSGVTPENKLETLDVLIESYGGDPIAGYRLAQLVRDFARNVDFLVPAHAYSAATILCFCGDTIRLGHLGGLSPIDLSLLYGAGDQPRSEVELASLDSFLEFAIRARQKTEQVLKTIGSKNGTNIDSDLLVAMVQEIGALTVGKYFRERHVTRVYAEELLNRYMLPPHLDAQHRSKSLIHNFLFGSPSHQFHLDYHLCVKFGLVVEEMSSEEFDRTRACLLELEKLAEQGIICQQVSPAYRLPFVRFYPVSAPMPATPETEIQPETVESATVQPNGAAASPNGHSEAKTKETTHESPKEEPEKART